MLLKYPLTKNRRNPTTGIIDTNKHFMLQVKLNLIQFIVKNL